VVRSARVKARLTEAEFALVAAAASRAGLSPGAWVSEVVVRAVSASDTAAASRNGGILTELVLAAVDAVASAVLAVLVRSRGSRRP
jgi:hypothetical protein